MKKSTANRTKRKHMNQIRRRSFLQEKRFPFHHFRFQFYFSAYASQRFSLSNVFALELVLSCVDDDDDR